MTWDNFERLAAEARRERPPVIDVRDRVAASIRILGAEPVAAPRTLLVAGSSLLLAAMVALACLPTWRVETSALTYLFESFQTTLP